MITVHLRDLALSWSRYVRDHYIIFRKSVVDIFRLRHSPDPRRWSQRHSPMETKFRPRSSHSVIETPVFEIREV
ncbi:MAG: hypothetical protein PHY09_11350 [Desulfuromonadaceae bacterium]|nr:hypothetical protein [Desulfuromonadaceae bacterium]MDD5106720.1 hypothetical protein [Desulfuromonadaceae bacterium]